MVDGWGDAKLLSREAFGRARGGAADGPDRLRQATLRTQALVDDLERAHRFGRDLAMERGRLVAEIEDHRAAYEALRAEAAETRAQCARLWQDVQSAEAALAAERARLVAEIEDHRAAYEALRAEAAETRAQCARLSQDVQAAEAALAESQDASAAAQTEAGALRRSTSWRLTRPLRSVTFRLRRLLR